jgi:hypothetical protein
MRALRSLLLTTWVAMLTTFGLAMTATAEDPDDETSSNYSRTGTYVSVSGVYVVESWPRSNRNAGAEDTGGFNFRVGQRVSQWVSAELEFEWVDDFFPNERQDLQLISTSANTRIYPLGGRVQPFVLGGLGIVSTIVNHRNRSSSIRQSNADWQFRGGGGIDFYYNDHIALTAEATYVWTVGDVKDLEHVSIGLGMLYRF